MVKELNELYAPHEKNIDIKKLILFGLIRGYLRKINKYPVSIIDTQVGIESSRKWLTGIYNYDKICSSLGMSIRGIDEQLDEDMNVYVIIK
jgi:hypothetical protein